MLDPTSLDRSDVDRGVGWPLTFDDEIEQGHRLVEAMVRFLRPALAEGDENQRCLAALSAKYLIEIHSLLRIHRIVDHFREADIELRTPPSMPLTRSVVAGEPRPPSPFLRSLERAVPKPMGWRRWSRIPREAFRAGPYRARTLHSFGRSEVVTVSRCPLTTAHALRDGIRPALVPCYEWLSPPTAAERSRPLPPPASPTAREGLNEALIDVAGGIGVQLGRFDREWMDRWLAEGSRWIRFYRNRLRDMPLPQTVWSTSSGIVWTRLIVDAVLDAGGRAVVHDHALGADYSLRSLMPFIETYRASRFFTFTPRQADLYRTLAPTQTLQEDPPEIDHLPAYRSPLTVHRESPPIRSICYVVPPYQREINGPQALMAAPPAISWQFRLLRLLREFGLRVFTKPHPEALYTTPRWLLEECEATELDGRFEETLDRFDAVLFDNPMTTTFGYALRSDKPVVLIDFAQARWPGDVREMLGRRCAIAPGVYDRHRIPDVDPTELRSAVRRAPDREDREYVDEILGPPLDNP